MISILIRIVIIHYDRTWFTLLNLWNPFLYIWTSPSTHAWRLHGALWVGVVGIYYYCKGVRAMVTHRGWDRTL